MNTTADAQRRRADPTSFARLAIFTTLNTVRIECPSIGCTWNTLTQEYRVSFRPGHLHLMHSLSFKAALDGAEAVAHYTNDADDAIATARTMQRDGYRR